MKILVLGSGGREHAIVWRLSQSVTPLEVLCTPGNGGICAEARCVGVGPANVDQLVELARQECPDLTVVGPEAPLVAGIVERFQEAGHPIFGPDTAAAQLEGSKCFAKEFLARHDIPTAAFAIFDDEAAARRHVETRPLPMVLKADGLAAGKGVIIARTRQQAMDAVEAILVRKRFGDAGNRLIVEDCLEGSEISFFIICDGETYVPLETAQDYKPARDGDEGPNTGGMGSYSPYLDRDDPRIVDVVRRIVEPTVDGLQVDGITYRGVLYFGIMLTAEGPQVLEFNVRLGDPETQVILPRLKTDMVEIVERAIEGRLAGLELAWDPRHAVTVVAASDGYPGSYPKGREISGLDAIDDPGVTVFHAGTRREPDGRIVTSGGRVLAVTALAPDREAARRKAYDALARIRFEGMQHRTDIASASR